MMRLKNKICESQRIRRIPAIFVHVMTAVALCGRGEANELALGGQSLNTQLLHRLQTEAVVKWKQMAEKLTSCSFDYTIIETNEGNRVNLARTKRVAGQVTKDCFLFRETIDSTGQVAVAARNRNYEFAISRSGEAPWSITWQNKCGQTSPVGSAYEYYAGMLQLPWSISAVPLAKLVTSPRFSLCDVKVTGNDTVRLQFKVQSSELNPDPLQNLAAGTVLLDSAHDWAIMKYEVA